MWAHALHGARGHPQITQEESPRAGQNRRATRPQAGHRLQRARTVHMSKNWQDPELIREFLEEAEEHLDSVDAALLDLEQRRKRTPQQSAAMALRSLHSIKGTAGYVDLFDIQELCHAGESLLYGLDAPGSERTLLDLSFDVVTLLRERLAEVRASCVADRPLPPNARLVEFVRRTREVSRAPSARNA